MSGADRSFSLDASSEHPIVIAGGGLGAVRTAEALRELHEERAIVMLSDERRSPYDRPPLSKGYLQGKVGDEQICLLPALMQAKLRIDLRLSSRVAGVDRSSAQVRLSNGERLAYGKLVVATGARPIRLPQFSGYDDVHVLRNADDAQRLRAALTPGRHIGIVGAGFIGLELASAAVGRGCRVTVIEASSAPLQPILGVELGRHVQRWHERHGVSFRCDTRVDGVRGAAQPETLPRVEALQLSGGEVLGVDAVIVGVGQLPNVEWLAESGLELQPGLVCDAQGRTLDPRIFGVGDAVSTRIGLTCRPTRQWTAVTEQARRVAALMCGAAAEPAIDDGYFWSDQHGTRLQFAGRVPAAPQLHWVTGRPGDDKFLALLCEQQEVRAVFSLGCPRDFLRESAALRLGRPEGLVT